MPTPLVVIGAILLFFALLLLLRIRLTIVLRDEVRLTLSILCLHICLFPRKPKKVKWRKYSPKRAAKIAARKAKKEAKQAAKKAKKAAEKHIATTERPQEKMTLAEKLMLVRALTATLLRKTHKHLKLKVARLHIRVATGDAASTAILYGAVSGVLASLLALLDRVTVLHAKKPEVTVFADYLSEKPSADVKLVFSLRVWEAFAILFAAAISYLRAKAAQKNARKRKQTTIDQTRKEHSHG